MIELLIINSLIIWGVYTSLQDGMIFEDLGDWVRGKYIPDTITYTKIPVGFHLPNWIKKPFATCPICMASVYGTPIFWGYYLYEAIPVYNIIFMYICYIFALAGLNYLILAFMPKDD